jgi:hypothetical protein
MFTHLPKPDLTKLIFAPLFRFTLPLTRSRWAEMLAFDRRKREDDLQCSFFSGTVADLMWSNKTDGSANANTSAETGMYTGLLDQPYLPAGFLAGNQGTNRMLQLNASGVGSTTSTPTVVGQWRLGSTQGVTQTGGTSIAQNAALACASGVTNLLWESNVYLQCRVAGMGSGNCTVSVAGTIGGPLFSSLQAQMVPGSGSPATWTTTFDATPALYAVFNTTWGTASSSNTMTLKRSFMAAWN